MSDKLFKITTFFLLFVLTLAPIHSQRLVCKPAALTALKPIPKLKYKCREDLSDYGDEMLQDPARVKAINLYTRSLEKLVSPDWWKTPVDDLDLCDFRKKAGALSKREKQQFQSGEYFFSLLGNNQFRVVVAKDPCFSTGYNGSDIFLLNRVGGRVFASEMIDGFFTRADLPLGVDYAKNGNEQIIEIATTTGGLYPMIIYYYFTIDKKTNRAKPKNLFKDEGKMTNQISSMMLLQDAEDYGLPPKSEALVIIKKGRLMRSFDVFVDNPAASTDRDASQFTIQKFRWNGKFYE